MSNPNRNIKNFEFLSEKEQYILKAKLILIVSQEGCVYIYRLVDYRPFQNTRVSLNFKSLENQPFTNYREVYFNCCHLKTTIPILDFNLSDNKFDNNENQDTLKLVTLHFNNFFTFWQITDNNDNIILNVQFSFTLEDFNCEKFLIDSNHEFLICFSVMGINIYLLTEQNFPYPLIYKYKFIDELPSLEEYQKITAENEIIDEPDIKEEIMKKMNKNNHKKLNNNKIKNKNKDNNQTKYEKDNDLFEGEECEELDDFFDEDNPDFIDTNIKTYHEEDIYLKNIQKPFFLSSETKFLFVNYQIKENLYTLYSFNFTELMKVTDDINFLNLCLNEKNPNLITKIYSSNNKIYISESPFYYYNPIKDNNDNKDLIKNKKGRDLLITKKFEFENLLPHIYHGLFIRCGDYIMLFKIGLKYEINNEMINNDINSSKYLFYEEPTPDYYKTNSLALFTINNTLIINSFYYLFTLIKFRNEFDVLGIAISKKKVYEYLKSYFNNNSTT